MAVVSAPSQAVSLPFPEISAGWVTRASGTGPEVFLRLRNLSPNAMGMRLVLVTENLADGFRVEAHGVHFLSAGETFDYAAGTVPDGTAGALRHLRLADPGPWRVTALISGTGPEPPAVTKLSLVVGKPPERVISRSPRKAFALRASHGLGPKRKGRCFMAGNIERTYRMEVRRPFAVKGDGFRHILTKGTVFQARVRTYHRGGIEVVDLKLDQCGQAGAPGVATAVPCGSIRFAEDSAKSEGRATGA
jgi:hypothetical protein